MNYDSEYKTRHEKIDVFLKQAGWDVKDNSKVLVEVDTKNSDFLKHHYKTVKETLNDPKADLKAYADYLLLDKFGAPLAIIEAKRSSKDPMIGQKQAEGYADDIERQTGKDVFIFLSNGYEIWFWNRALENPRMVKGFHSLKALERIRYQNSNQKPFLEIQINQRIADRDYQLEAIKRITEGLEKGRRKFLIVHATGTGKTRTAMALIDILLRTNRAQKVLFLADRKALKDQAYDNGFLAFFTNEKKCKVSSKLLKKNCRLFVSTIQTFMECYREFSIGDFDVIISDECHRSIYNKWKDVFTYFDAIEIGLTATPSEMIEKDTFRFFDCHNNIPTNVYTYEDAVDDKWLVPFDIYKTQTHFQISGVTSADVPSNILKELLESGVEPDEINFEGSDIERKVAVIGTNEAIVKEFMENCLTDATGTLPAKTIIFAVTKKHARRLWEAFERLYPEYKGQLARIITSDDPRAKQLISDFKKEGMPRIAISVDMLDTGIDIPEVCNLVFAKPVFSKIKFWQMIGRGTRSDHTCKKKEWLPNGKKEIFRIFDCWKVFDWFNIHPEGREIEHTEAVTTKIFLTRLSIAKYFENKGKEDSLKRVRTKIIKDIDNLPINSVTVQEHLRDVEQAKSNFLWNTFGLDAFEFLKKKISPLMKYKVGIEPNEASYTQKCEELSLALLTKDIVQAERAKEAIAKMLQSLPLSIKEVRDKKPELDKALTASFWQYPSYEDIQTLLETFAPLMKFKRPEPIPMVILDIDDIMEKREIIQYGLPTSPKTAYIQDYRQKVEEKIKKLAAGHPTITKIERGDAITEEDLKQLEATLNSSDLFITEEILQKVYNQNKGTLVQFIKNILGLYEFPDSEKQVSEAFRTFMVEKNYLNADQVNFLRTIQTVFAKRRHIEFADLYDPPFTSFGQNAALRLFRKEELDEVLQICKILEAEANKHA
jgi:type I restriction enzyme R subunit